MLTRAKEGGRGGAQPTRAVQPSRFRDRAWRSGDTARSFVHSAWRCWQPGDRAGRSGHRVWLLWPSWPPTKVHACGWATRRKKHGTVDRPCASCTGALPTTSKSGIPLVTLRSSRRVSCEPLVPSSAFPMAFPFVPLMVRGTQLWYHATKLVSQQLHHPNQKMPADGPQNSPSS